MTFEEMQQAIVQMLEVQRELKESQFRQQKELDRLMHLLDRLISLKS